MESLVILPMKSRREHVRKNGSISVALVQRELEKRRKYIAGRARSEAVRRFLADKNFFQLCNPRFPLDSEMITFS